MMATVVTIIVFGILVDAQVGRCTAFYPEWVGNGRCEALFDSRINTPECDYDGGDCCPDTCVDGIYDCGSVLPYYCVRPTENRCEARVSCSNCATLSDCGWCATSRRCLNGTDNGPLEGSCPLWERFPTQCGQHKPMFWAEDVLIPSTPVGYGPDAYIYPAIQGIIKGAQPPDGCDPVVSGSLEGNIVLLDTPRFGCSFATQSLNAQKAGAIGVVLKVDISPRYTLIAPSTFNQSLLTVPTLYISTSSAERIDVNGTQTGLLGLVGEGPLFSNESAAIEPGQGIIFFDEDFIQTYDEGGRVLDALKSITGGNGTYKVQLHRFASTLARDPPPPYAVIPSQSSGPILPFLTTTERKHLRSYVERGGRLVLMGDRFYNAINFIQEVFNIPMSQRPGDCMEPGVVDLEGDPLADTPFQVPIPSTISIGENTFCVSKVGLKEGAAIYSTENARQTERLAGVTYNAIGKGSVSYLGFDFSAFPTPIKWSEILERSIGATGTNVDDMNPKNASMVILNERNVTSLDETLYLRNAILSGGFLPALVNVSQLRLAMTRTEDRPNIVVIPKLSRSHLNWVDLFADDIRESVKEYVSSGGFLFIVGSASNLDTALLNNVFDFELTNLGECRFVVRNPNINGTSGLDYTTGYRQTSCISYLPSGSTSLYLTDNKFATMIGSIPFGSGGILYFGFDFSTFPVPLAMTEIVNEVLSVPYALDKQIADPSPVRIPTKTAAACDGSTAVLSCDAYSSIDITSAFYGTDPADKLVSLACSAGADSEICESEETLAIINAKCQGKQSCVVNTNPELLDPNGRGSCGTPRALRVRYRCLPGKETYISLGLGWCRDVDLSRPTYCQRSVNGKGFCLDACSAYKGCQSVSVESRDVGGVQNLACNMYFDSDNFELDIPGWACIYGAGRQVYRVDNRFVPSGRSFECLQKIPTFPCRQLDSDQSTSYPANTTDNVYLILLETSVYNDGRFIVTTSKTDQFQQTIVARIGIGQWEYWSVPAARWVAFRIRRTDVIIAMDKRDGGVLQFEKFQVTSLDNFRMQNGVTKGYFGNISISASTISTSRVFTVPSGQLCFEHAPPSSIDSTPSPTASPTTVLEAGVKVWEVVLTIEISFDEVTDELRAQLRKNIMDLLGMRTNTITIVFSPGSVLAGIQFKSSEPDGRSPKDLADQLSGTDTASLSTALKIPVTAITIPQPVSTDGEESNNQENSNSTMTRAIVVVIVIFFSASICGVGIWYLRRRKNTNRTTPQAQMANNSQYGEARGTSASISALSMPSSLPPETGESVPEQIEPKSTIESLAIESELKPEEKAGRQLHSPKSCAQDENSALENANNGEETDHLEEIELGDV